MNQTAYVGVTGITDRRVADQIKGQWNLFHSTHRLMLGVLTSTKTLQGFSNKHPMLYPQMPNIAHIFPSGNGSLNLIHHNSEQCGYGLLGEMLALTVLGGPNFHGFQLNGLIGVPHTSIAMYKAHHPDKYIILQVNKSMMAQYLMHNDEDPFMAALEPIEEFIDGILLDVSGGEGQSFDPTFCLRWVSALRRYRGVSMIGIAGGLSAGSIEKVVPFIELDNYISWDAQGKLCKNINQGLILETVLDYLEASQQALQAHQVLKEVGD